LSPFDPVRLIAELPSLPGVYRMLGKDASVLYVGKARDLKKRVASYFQKTSSLSPRIALMVAQICNVETMVTRSEAEALILENNLIKGLRPRYNILFRDDKSYPYIVITGHPTPRLGFHRGALEKSNRYFGPFPNAHAVRESIQLIQKLFRLRTCEESVFQNRSRPCLLYQIKRCSGPCVGLIDRSDYAESTQDTILFLDGKEDQVLVRAEARMADASARHAYEEAALYRDQIRSLQRVREKQYVSSARAGNADIVAIVEEQETVCVNLTMVRAGQNRGDRSFFPDNAQHNDALQALEAFLVQHYLDRDIPEEIIVNRAFDSGTLCEVFSAQAGYRVHINSNPAGERRVWLEMTEKNARLAIARRINSQITQEARLKLLQQALGLPDTVHRIECFDISHTMGEATVASCVIYDRSAMQPGEYRRFNIAGVAPGDDYGAMRQVLERRYAKIVAGEAKLPDLLLIDGGKGQLSVAVQVLQQLGVDDVPIVGVAKGEERKAGLEQLIFPDRDEPLQLAPDHPGLHLIQQIRDEAHRFAIDGHRRRRSQARTHSSLENIAGIGAKRRQRLLARFGGLKGVASASLDDLQQVEGISRALAEKIYAQLH
jgi:excinuclease ABC subunit C